MIKKRTSPIWKMPKSKFESLVKKSSSISEIIRYFGFTTTGNVQKTVKQRCKEDNIDISHIPLGLRSNKGRMFIRDKTPLKEIMIKNSSYSRGHLKKRLLKEGILENKCSLCGQLPVWQDKILVMRIDHINGNNTDHRLINLRIVCPNCDSQLSTFCGRNHKNHRFCQECSSKITKSSKSGLCATCSRQRRQKERPPIDILKKEVKQLGFSGTGRKYDVSDNCIRKWLKR